MTPLRVRDVLAGHFLAITGHPVIAMSLFMVVAALLHGFDSWWAVACLPIGVLTGVAFTTTIFACTATQEGDSRWLERLLLSCNGARQRTASGRLGSSRLASAAWMDPRTSCGRRPSPTSTC
ncbi:MAG: hypothetical protein ABIQ13_02980 [Pedococcus sp.]